MGKHESPPFRMTVENGRLVPATAYDQERLETYRRGTPVRVRFVEERDRVMIRKWWAAINRAVKECQTPWKTAAEASEAIKLAIGVVNLTKTVGGSWLQYPKSLTELTDPELDDAVRDMIDVLYGVTGVDPEEWRKQLAGIVADQPETEPSDETPSQSPAESPSPDEAREGSGAAHPHAVGAAAASDERKRELIDKFVRLARDASLSVEDRVQALGDAADAWRNALPELATLVTAARQAAEKVARREMSEAKASDYLEGLLK